MNMWRSEHHEAGGRGLGLTAVLAGALCLGAALDAPVADAGDSTCRFTPSTGELEVTSARSVWIDVFDDKIRVQEAPSFEGTYVVIPCPKTEAPGDAAAPRLTETETVRVAAPGLAMEPLEPGRTTVGEGDAPEIEVYYDGRGGAEVIAAEPQFSPPVNRTILLGRDSDTGEVGININAGQEGPASFDTDVVFTAQPSHVSVLTGTGNDLVSAAGGGHFEEPLAIRTSFSAGEGADVLRAGTARAYMSVGDDTGDDQFYGSPENDSIAPGAGDDLIVGGPGLDELLFGIGPPPLRLNLGLAGPQDTGFGIDTLSGVENVFGSSHADVLIGNGASNRIEGFGGDDSIRSGAGDDRVDGEDGADSVRGGAGDDRLDGGGGKDRLSGGLGIDSLLARDGRRDPRLRCGPGADEDERILRDPQDPPAKSC